MADALYPLFKQRLLDPTTDPLDLVTNDIRAILVDTGAYSYNAAHEFLSDVAAGARIAVSGALAGASVALGVFDTNDFAWTLVTGVACEAVILYQHTGAADANRRLIAYFDTPGGLPITPNGQDINFTVHASGWFAL